MNAASYLMFNLNRTRCGISTAAVQEIFLLPEITPIPESSTGILGVINLRGDLLPVLDLYGQVGQQRPPFQLTDSMIVLKWQTHRVSVVVSQVDRVETISTEQITTHLYGQTDPHLLGALVTSMATIEDEIVTLLNPEWLVQSTVAQPVSQSYSDSNSRNSLGNGVLKYDTSSTLGQEMYDHLDGQSRQRLRERSEALRCPISEQDTTDLVPLAVVSLGGEYFGLGLDVVHEFTEIHKVTPVPCCPEHIIGNINLRGEIITLINVSSVVNLPMRVGRSHPQAVIVQMDRQMAGIAVDDIFDVTYIHPSQITAVSTTVHSAKEDYLQGVVPYHNHIMTLINLPKLLASSALIVDEEV